MGIGVSPGWEQRIQKVCHFGALNYWTLWNHLIYFGGLLTLTHIIPYSVSSTWFWPSGKVVHYNGLISQAGMGPENVCCLLESPSMVLNQTWTNPSAGNRLLPACCIFSAGNALSSLEGKMLSRQFFASVEPKPSNIRHRDELGFSGILATMVFTMVRLVRWEFPWVSCSKDFVVDEWCIFGGRFILLFVSPCFVFGTRTKNNGAGKFPSKSIVKVVYESYAGITGGKKGPTSWHELWRQ